MRLQDRFPYHVDYGGQRYKIKPYFDNVLSALDILNGEEMDYVKVDCALYALVDGRYPVDVGLLDAIFEALKEDKRGDDKTYFDLVQDAAFIYAAFWQTYGIDLQKEHGRLHWKAFIALLGALPENTRFAEIIKIRAMPMPEPNEHNSKERTELAKLKARYALKISEKEREENMQAGLARMWEALEQWARNAK